MLASTFAGLYVLAALACPVGMGLMMVFMGKGMMGGKTRDQSAPEMQDEQQSLAALKEEQARLADKIATLERQAADPPGPDGEQTWPRHASLERRWSERAPA
jgi:hypothetical protein